MPLFGFGQSSQPAHQKAKEVANDGKRQIRSENRHLERDVKKLHDEEAKLKRQLESYAKQGNKACVQSVAKQIVQNRHAIERLEKTQGKLNSASTQLTCAATSASVAHSMQQSASIMKEVGALVDVSDLQDTMNSMQREIAKAEMADEIIDEAFSALDDEAEIDDEMSKIFEELELDAHMTMGGLSSIPAYVPSAPVPTAPVQQSDDPLAARLKALQAA
jgi:division protein CdvB (Snf7/Vps24/ESCRT-III family)